MGNLDVPKVIQAAASSSLGVLSLLVLVLAFLAWRFFQRSDDRVKLVAFGLIFLGAIGFGASVFLASGSKEANASVTPSPTPSASPSDISAARPTPAADTTTAAAQDVDVSGEWHGDDGYRFHFTQQGEGIRYEALHNGKPAGSGEGTLRGRALRYRFSNVESSDQGSCEAKVSGDGRVIEGSCRSDGGGAAWDLRIER